MRILVIEDEPKLNAHIAASLRDEGYAVDNAFDGEDGERLARTSSYDAIILDILLPKQDGLVTCKHIRDAGIGTPILLLTAKGTTEDKVVGLDQGADDYLVKPFSFAELSARLRALLRRPKTSLAPVVELGNIRIDTPNQEVTIGGKKVPFTLREFRIFELLAQQPNTLVSREQILEHVWDRSFDSFSNVVDVHMRNIRKKLPTPYGNIIETVRGTGYRLRI